MSTPLVSVVIPTFNRADLIGEAIDSVVAQEFDGCEIIVVDDGSTDGTEARVRAYESAVLYVRTEHGGVARARNVGTRLARGRYVTFLDSDDRHYPYTLALLTRLLDRLTDVAFVCSEMSGFDDHGFFERYHLKKYHRSTFRDPKLTYDQIFSRGAPLSDLCDPPEALVGMDPEAAARQVFVGNVFDWYLMKLVLCQNTVMVRRQVLSSAGERNERIKYWEGVDILLRVCRHHMIGFVDVPTYQLRYHDGQISTTTGPDGKYVWMRKQQILLRVTKRHALADAAYYQRHRARIDTHLAALHRAVAVPMMLSDTPASTSLGYGSRARRYLRRCAQYGRPELFLWLMSFMPGPVRRFGVTVLEEVRGFLPSRFRHISAVAA